jgi:FkbM family methyltransferase
MLNSIWEFSRHWAYTLRLSSGLRSFGWANRLMRAGLTGGNFQVAPDGRLVLGELGVAILPGSQEFFLEGYTHALAAHQAGVRFSIEDGQPLATIGGVRTPLETFDDLFILHEIYGQGAYGISGPGDLLIFDIGMNVGHGSLYFANRFPHAEVLGFEPFKPTFDRAAANFAKNPSLARRIHPFNFGLAAADGNMEVDFDPVIPGRMGLFGIPEDLKTSSDKHRERVLLRDVASVFDQAVIDSPNRPILMKIDCEGAEYEILSRLHDCGRLRQVHALAVEWHRKAAEHDPKRLEAMMADAGFTVISQGSPFGSAGMIYAVNAALPVIEATVPGEESVACPPR